MDKVQTCGFYIVRKKRFCKMAAKTGKKFCAEHGVGVKGEEEGREDERIPCPYDPKHNCCLSKLKKHLKKCNGRPKELPDYIIPQINVRDEDYPIRGGGEEDVYPIASVSDCHLERLIRRIEKIYSDERLDCKGNVLEHDIMKESLGNSELGMNTRKHLVQNSSLLGNMEEMGFLKDNITFVEFGAGRGKLGYWICQAVENNENCSLLLVDRASHRHKSDNKLKGVSPVVTSRIRADIGDLALWKVPFLTESGNEVVGVAKHLCGVATDLALRCMVEGKSKGLKTRGLAVAFCCHHRCTWTSFVGKKFLLDSGFTPNEFSALCSISSWATCGSGRPRQRKKEEEDERDEGLENDRDTRLGLNQEIREEIGRKCKMILNHARLKYLERFEFRGKMVYYVEQKISPENVCLIAEVEKDEKC